MTFSCCITAYNLLYLLYRREFMCRVAMRGVVSLGMFVTVVLAGVTTGSAAQPSPCPLVAEQQAGEREIGRELQRSFIWLESAPTGQQVFAVFRKQFEMAAEPVSATLHLFADSRYILWINGQYIERGPCRFDPVAPEYDTLDVRPHLRQGVNAIAVLVHHYHDGKSSTDWDSICGRIMRHAPGLTARLEMQHADGQITLLPTDDTWLGTTETRFLPAPTDRWEDTWASIPDRVDARRDPGDWTLPEFDDSDWEKPVSVDGTLWGLLRPRGIPRLRESDVGPLTLLEHASEAPDDEAAYWIWTRETDYPQQRAPRWSAPEGERFFRRRLMLPAGVDNVVIWTTADNEWDCYFNGVKVGEKHGDIGSWMTMQRMDVTSHVRPGQNVIAIRAINKHYGTASDPAGLLAVVTWRVGTEHGRLVTNSQWQASTRGSTEWEQPDYEDSNWDEALACCPYPEGPWKENLHNFPRELAYQQAPRQLATVLPLTLRAGDRLVIDAGEFAQAYSVLDVEAATGSEFELEYAQNYFDTGNKASGSYGRFNRYIARQGRQSYMSTDTFGFKYVVLRMKSGQATLHGLRLVNRLYPFDVVGSFRCNDELLNQLWNNCVQTIRVCSEDAYVDCATRERAEWMADGYVVAYRTTRVAFAGPGEDGTPRIADPRLLRNLLRHIGQSCQQDGHVKAHHPSDRWDIHGYIEDYSCLWVQALREYSDHTGDLQLARELWPAVTKQLQWFLDRRQPTGLVEAREFVYFGNPLLYKTCSGATLNAFVYAALVDASYLADRLGETDQSQTYGQGAQDVYRAVNQHLWDESSQTYFGSITAGTATPPTAHAAVSCLHFGLVPEQRERRVRDWLLAHYHEEGFYPYTHQFLLEEIYRSNSEPTDREALDLIRTRWAAMAKSETGTCWEGFGPGENCHEAGAVPAYFLSAYVLGVRLDGPVTERRLLIQPRLADLTEAEGTVVTELGLVPVRWKRSDSDGELEFDLQVPPHTRATVILPCTGENTQVILDGDIVRPPRLKCHGPQVSCEVGPGRHQGRSYEDVPVK